MFLVSGISSWNTDPCQVRFSVGMWEKALATGCIICRIIYGSRTVHWFRNFSRKYRFRNLSAGSKSFVWVKILSPLTSLLSPLSPLLSPLPSPVPSLFSPLSLHSCFSEIATSAKIPQEAKMSENLGCISRKKGAFPQGNAVYTSRALKSVRGVLHWHPNSSGWNRSLWYIPHTSRLWFFYGNIYISFI